MQHCLKSKQSQQQYTLKAVKVKIVFKKLQIWMEIRNHGLCTFLGSKFQHSSSRRFCMYHTIIKTKMTIHFILPNFKESKKGDQLTCLQFEIKKNYIDPL